MSSTITYFLLKGSLDKSKLFAAAVIDHCWGSDICKCLSCFYTMLHNRGIFILCRQYQSATFTVVKCSMHQGSIQIRKNNGVTIKRTKKHLDMWEH
jgi:hypothetical protein